ncbi:MAG: hypothetical protein LIO90_09625 [Bacteroidales bacterium]|nr:hypothetical protein [Bacteroidales bacterium]
MKDLLGTILTIAIPILGVAFSLIAERKKKAQAEKERRQLSRDMMNEERQAIMAEAAAQDTQRPPTPPQQRAAWRPVLPEEGGRVTRNVDLTPPPTATASEEEKAHWRRWRQAIIDSTIINRKY